MTRLAKIMAASLLFNAALLTTAFAQQSIASAETDYAKTTSEIVTNNSRPVAVNAKTKASFVMQFPNASKPLWASIGDNYYVSFLNNGRKASAVFTAKGGMNYCMTECSMENLPESFRKTIQKEYAGYSLLKGTEIKAYGTIAYQAVLENNTGFKTLKYTEDGIEQIGQIKKQ